MGEYFDRWEYNTLNSHARVPAGAVADWLRALGTDPVLGFVLSVGSGLLSVFGLCLGSRMRGYQR